jgi:hypothetical protein
VANTTPKDYLGKTIMVVGNSTKDAYAEFAEAAAERAVNAGGTALKNTNPVQLRPTNVDGAPPVLNIKTHGASGPSGSVESAPWVIGSNVRPNNGIISPARSDPLMVTVPKPGDVPTRFGSINGGSGETGGLLSRAAGLAPPRQSPSRGMSLSRSPSVSPLRTADLSPARASPASAVDPAPTSADTAYDGILDGYGDGEEMSAPRRKPTMVGTGSTRALSTRGPPSSYSPAGAPRGAQRQMTMRSTYSRGVRAASIYDGDGEIPLRLIKIKVRGARAQRFTA